MSNYTWEPLTHTHSSNHMWASLGTGRRTLRAPLRPLDPQVMTQQQGSELRGGVHALCVGTQF